MKRDNLIGVQEEAIPGFQEVLESEMESLGGKELNLGPESTSIYK
jgi:hypothetical protein